MKRPWIPFWPVDYLADTQHLATVQHGAYFLLILHYWTHGGLPDNERELARITKLPLHSWRAMSSTIQQFFHDGWKHKRIDADLVKVGLVVEKRKRAGSIGGTKSAIARWNGKQTSSKPVSKTVSKTQANVKLLEEDIKSSFVGAARARPEPPEEKPAKSTNEENHRSESGSMVPPKIVSVAAEIGAALGLGSNELRSVLLAKRWA